MIAARAQEEAMAHVLPFKVKEIEQDGGSRPRPPRVARVKAGRRRSGRAPHRGASGEADSRRKLRRGGGGSTASTRRASASAQLERDSALIAKNPLMIQKTIADKLSDKIQVIIAPPQAGGFFAGGAHRARSR